MIAFKVLTKKYSEFFVYHFLSLKEEHNFISKPNKRA